MSQCNDTAFYQATVRMPANQSSGVDALNNEWSLDSQLFGPNVSFKTAVHVPVDVYVRGVCVWVLVYACVCVLM